MTVRIFLTPILPFTSTQWIWSKNLVGWYGSAYLCGFQLAFGKCYSISSIKWTFLTAIAIFELGSSACGIASTSTALIVGRAVDSLGCAGIFSGALIIIAYSVPLIRAMYGIASIAGMNFLQRDTVAAPDETVWTDLTPRAATERRLYRPTHLAMVFLHQPGT